MIDHFSITVKDIERSKDFYKKVLAPLHGELKLAFDGAANFGKIDVAGGQFWLAQGEPKPNHFAFRADSKEEVAAFYTAGLEAGGTDNGGPGLRPEYHEKYYAAFIIDPDGYNIEAVYYGE
ncbi:VOC family protein [Enterococcus sp. LJL51]|uniref:VOC family protein n=1 Tax=Enterococcus sp. LJL51 TaxID=3416656 RepID=UPI003CF01486